MRRTTGDDGPSVREIRLEMLSDYPLGFLETNADAVSLTDQDWTARAVRGSVHGDSYQVLALAPRPVASSFCFVRDGVLWWAAVYVAPAVRGTGLLGEMLDQVSAWGRSRGHVSVDLEVHEDNRRALRAYAKLGFLATGDRQPYPLPPGGGLQGPSRCAEPQDVRARPGQHVTVSGRKVPGCPRTG